MTNMNGGKSRGIVIGGGVAGTVAALALHKVGCDAVVYEARPAAADGAGSFLTLAVNGIAALRAVDLDARTFGGFETPRIALRLGNGRLLAEIDSGPSGRGRGVCLTLRRADLYAALRRAAEARGIPQHYGKRLVSAEAADGGVVARFDDGTEARGDFLIGADGVHSRVRSLIDPRAPRESYVGLLNTGGQARGVRVEGAPGTMQMYFGRRCFFAYIPHPNGEVWWFANPAEAKEPPRESLERVTAEGWRARLLDLFAGDASPALELIHATEEVPLGWPSHDLPRVPRWHRDGMLIVGDAAHAASPSSGQGASMAIEDAVVLGRCVRDSANPQAAFVAYEAERRARVERVVAQGRKNGSGKTPHPLGRWARDLALRLVFRGGKPPGAPDQLEWLYDYDVRWNHRDDDQARLLWA